MYLIYVLVQTNTSKRKYGSAHVKWGKIDQFVSHPFNSRERSPNSQPTHILSDSGLIQDGLNSDQRIS